MDSEHFSLSNPTTRINSISDEIAAMNSLILSQVDQLPKQPELVAQLIRRCEELTRELKAIPTTSSNGQAHAGDRETLDPSLDGSGLNA